jgi:hypothetical protein
MGTGLLGFAENGDDCFVASSAAGSAEEKFCSVENL